MWGDRIFSGLCRLWFGGILISMLFASEQVEKASILLRFLRGLITEQGIYKAIILCCIRRLWFFIDYRLYIDCVLSLRCRLYRIDIVFSRLVFNNRGGLFLIKAAGHIAL